MKVELFRISEFQVLNVAFYSIKLGNNADTEYLDFVKRMNIKPEDKTDLAELRHYIKSTIGENKLGAEQRFFKKEGSADRIKQPTPETYDEFAPDPKNYGLRLFCYVASEKVVILFNGDRKTRLEVNSCPNCSPYFGLAQKIAQAIDIALYADKKLSLNEFEIEYLDDDYEIEIT